MIQKHDWWPQPFRRLVALGESTTAGGWSTDRQRCWVSRLANLISDFQDGPIECLNHGIGANVISTKSPAYQGSGKPPASERLDKHVIEPQPDLLIISYGLNDARGGTPVELFIAEFETLISRVRARIDPLIVVLGPYFMTDFQLGGEVWSHGSIERFETYNRAIAQLSKRTDCLFVDLLPAYDCASWLVHYDGVHANDVGHCLVANKVFEVLASNCSGLAVKTKEAEKTSPRWRDESVLQAQVNADR